MNAAQGFTLLMAIGLASATYGAGRARLYVRANPSRRIDRATASRMLIQQVLIAVALVMFLVVGVLASYEVDGRIGAAVEVVALFAAPVVLVVMSVLHNIALWRIEHME